jgi:hypothetical protein
MGVEEFDQLGEVGERAGQPVDLVDDYDVDPATANIIKELLERWPLYRAAKLDFAEEGETGEYVLTNTSTWKEW